VLAVLLVATAGVAVMMWRRTRQTAVKPEHSAELADYGTGRSNKDDSTAQVVLKAGDDSAALK